jgi:catalase
VAILANEAETKKLSTGACAVDWVRDAFGHLKVIAHTKAVNTLLARAGIDIDDGVLAINDRQSVSAFIKKAKNGRIWDREPKVRSPG